MKTPIYLDYNATSPIRPAVIDRVAAVMAEVGNPSSVHSAGRAARATVEMARVQVAALVNARPRDVTFCGCGTEANNTVVRGTGAASLIIAAIEHDSTLAAAKLAGVPVFTIPVDAHGTILLDELESLLAEAPKPALVSVMLVNNETGVIQPIAEAAKLAHVAGARIHTDAVQGAGKLTLDRAALDVDYMTLSAHKIGGPQGVGAIITAPTAPLSALIGGGGQELSRRSGTENVAGIAGFGEAAIAAMGALADMDRIGAMRTRLEAGILTHANEAVIAGTGANRTANTSCITMPGVKGETQVMHFDLAGICVSSGSACSSGKVKVSHVLRAMGYEDAAAESSIRVSLGYGTRDEDIDAFLSAWQALYNRTRGR